MTWQQETEQQALERMKTLMDPERFIVEYARGLYWRFPECCVLAFVADGTGTYGWVHHAQADGRGFVACDNHDTIPRMKRGLRNIIAETKASWPCYGPRALVYAVMDALPGRPA